MGTGLPPPQKTHPGGQNASCSCNEEASLAEQTRRVTSSTTRGNGSAALSPAVEDQKQRTDPPFSGTDWFAVRPIHNRPPSSMTWIVRLDSVPAGPSKCSRAITFSDYRRSGKHPCVLRPRPSSGRTSSISGRARRSQGQRTNSHCARSAACASSVAQGGSTSGAKD